MRQDQREKLEALQEEVIDQFLDNAPPRDWPGWDSQEDRGERYWFIKIKAAELTLAEKITNVLERRGSVSVSSQRADEEKLDKTIKKFEKKIEAAMPDKLMSKYRKPATNSPTH